MNKYKNILKIKELYERGENIIQYLRSSDNADTNSINDILISYDLQSGTYLKSLSENSEFKERYAESIAAVIEELLPAGNLKSIMEIGVGEATTLGLMIKNLKSIPEDILGFDISLSRILFAQNFLKEINLPPVKLFTANLFEIPLKDDSVDIVYTSHSIEPNGGNEKTALKELFRVARKYVILLEPSYEFATEEGKSRMEKNGYVKYLAKHATELGYKVIENKLFDLSINHLNPTGITIIEKLSMGDETTELVCPATRTKLNIYNHNLLYSDESFLAYPVIENIPCLLTENAILSFHLKTDFQHFKQQNNLSF